jgi:Fe-S cluster assembly scaffold protein SufB
MAIHSFLKAEKGDPDWQFSPEHYFGKEFKMIDASTIELSENQTNMVVLRQNPTERDLLAKHLKIEIKSQASLDLIILNEADNKLQQIFLYDIHVEEGAGINLGIFAKDGKFNKHIFQVYLEEGAEFNTYGLLNNTVGGDTEIITKIVHRHPNSFSNQFIVGIAGKQSQTVFQGMAVLDANSEGSEANIECLNLISADSGRCYSKPDIYSDCNQTRSSHGCITDCISNDKLYYLQTKGLSKETAKSTIVNSFQNKVFSIIPFDDVREEARQMFSE